MEHAQTGFLNNDFRTCLAQLMTHGIEAYPRGTITRELLNYNITLRSARNRIITFPARNTNTKYLLGEFIWYLTGSNTPDGILPYSKFWANLVNDGNTQGYAKGTINSNYGHRLFGLHAPFIHQWQETTKLLIRDRDSRQAIMNIHLPADRHEGNKDVPCTLTLQWFIRENALHLVVNMRSNDVILGFTNDVFQFTMLQECMLMELKKTYPDLELGHYYHNAGSMHIYDRHFEMAKKIINDPLAMDFDMIPMDRFDADIVQALIRIEGNWQDEGGLENFEFSEHKDWSNLSPYWQTLVKAMFAKDEVAMRAIFGFKEEVTPPDARAYAEHLSGDFRGSDF